MKKTFYFMAGLPRSGSSVLSSILNQNPRLYSGPSSPVLPMMIVLESYLNNCELFNAYPKVEQVENIISSMSDQFYEDIEKPVIIDKNRAWTSRIAEIEKYFKTDAKIICPVRDVDEILTSLITMIRRNPYQRNQERINFIDEQLVKLNIPLNDNNRCQYLIGSNGILGQSLESLSAALKSNFSDKIHLVEYKDIIKFPNETMNSIYNFLGEDYYEHDFDNLRNYNKERDLETYGIDDMHHVRSSLKDISLDPKDVLSKQILDYCKNINFWRQ